MNHGEYIITIIILLFIVLTAVAVNNNNKNIIVVNLLHDYRDTVLLQYKVYNRLGLELLRYNII